MSDRPRLLGLRLAALAGALQLACDVVGTRLEWTTPPYLLLDYAGELFRELVAVDRTSVFVAMSIGASLANGAIAALIGLALEEVGRRRRVLAGVLFGLWVFSGALLIAVYLNPPWGLALASLATGLPRSALVAWAIDRALPPRAAAATAGGTGA